MSEDAWPVVFIGWQSRKEAIFTSVQKAELTTIIPNGIHIRRGARSIVILEDGELLGVGNIVSITKNGQRDICRFSWEATAQSPTKLPRLSGQWLEKLQTLPKTLLTLHINPLILSPSSRFNLNTKWFHDVERFALTQLQPAQKLKPGVLEEELNEWLPPALQPLLTDYVPTDQWELLVAKAFIALGCNVEVLGHTKPGKAEPDCLVKYISPLGQVTELVIDAKAGQWGGAVEDLRAMQEYQANANPYTLPLFVANQLHPETQERLKQYNMHGKTARAITGTQLAVLIVHRLTQPEFNVEKALRGLK